jgi:ankyrin repeat protein
VLKFSEETHKDIYQHLKEKPRYREFLSRYRLMYSQANEKQMDRYIIPPLQEKLELPDSEGESACQYFCNVIMGLWQEKDRSYFLTACNIKGNDALQKTSEKVRKALIANVLDQRKSELDALSFKYEQPAITYMEQLTEHNRAVLIFAPGRSTNLTAAKIHQMLGATEHTVLKLQQFMRFKSDVMLAWKNVFDVLVLESERSTENLQGVLNEISVMLNECGVEKRFIFIANITGNIEQISALRRAFRTELREVYDDWHFKDMVTETRKFFLRKKVTFQGSVIQIKSLVKEIDVHMFNALDCDSMSLLLANEKPAIGVKVENPLKYYIDRTLECKNDDKFCSQNERKMLIPAEEGTVEEEQCTGTCREKNCNISDYEQHDPQLLHAKEIEKETTKLCNATNKLQCLCEQEEQHVWEKNTDVRGSENRKLQENITTSWRPNTLLDGENRIVLVTDEPGMGKSTLLTHLGKQTRERHPDVWIVRVNINNYTNLLHDVKTNGFDEESAIKLITEAAQINETDSAQFGKKMFNYVYNSTGNMVVMIDGVDEVSPHYTEEVIQIVRILSKTKIRKIWVTSRNSVNGQLEEEFHCRSYSLTPFSVEDQKSFLIKFWRQKFLHVRDEYFESLAHRVIELSSKHLSVREKKFLGTPLQSMLLAEVFEECLKQSSTLRTAELPKNINILMLYDRYVEKKWNIYLSEKKLSDRTNVNVLTDDEALYNIFIDNHKAAALVAILSPQHLEKISDKSVLEKGAAFVQRIKQGLEKTGIINDIIEGRPVFLHRTFGEFFVARRLCDNTFDCQIFMRDHLFESGFDVVRSMVDRILANNCPLHQAVLNSNLRHVARLLKKKESITQKDRGGRTPLHVAVSCRSQEIIRLLLEHGADIRSVDTLLGLSPVDYASRMVDWQILSLLMEKRPDIREQVLSEMNFGCTEYIASVLRAAAKDGHTDLLRYLIGRENCVNMALPGDSGTLLYEAARGNNIQTVRALVDLGASCDIQDANGKTALHVSAETGSLAVTKFLVERQETSCGETEMKDILILNRAITKLNRLNLRDNEGNRPLHLATAAGNTSTMLYLVNAGSDLRSCNRRGEYPLTVAAGYGRNDIVKLLLQSCCAVKHEKIMTSALTAAIVAGQVDTTALLLRSGAQVNGGENEKPIHIASRVGHKEIVSTLLQIGASLTSLTQSGNLALHLASEAGHMYLVKYLVE